MVEQGATRITIRPDLVASTVTTAMEASLANSRQRIARESELLAIDVHPQPQQLDPGKDFVPLTIEPVLYLDRFSSLRSEGLGEFQTDAEMEMQKVGLTIGALERRRHLLTTQGTSSVVQSLTDSIEYFDLRCQARDDQLRAESQAEAAEKLKWVLTAVQSEVASEYDGC